MIAKYNAKVAEEVDLSKSCLFMYILGELCASFFRYNVS